MKLKKISHSTTPLAFLADGKLVTYHGGKIMIFKEDSIVKSIPIRISIKERLLGWSRLFSRLLRFGVRSSLPIDDQNIILSVGNILYELNIETTYLSKGWCCKEGARPLALTEVRGINGFQDGFYFGEYLQNNKKNPVSIYRRVAQNKWESIYTFSNGLVNHVHNIVADPYNNCLWVLTGDFDEAAAIWKVTDNFNKVERIVYNDQKYRGCVAFATPNGLLYATDTPFSDNYIYLFKPNNQETIPLFHLHGSCIYGCMWKDNFVFSSTVEGDGRDESLWDFFFDREKGPGIIDEYVHLYIGNPDKGFKEIYSEKKDRLSFLFQFGAFKFPSGPNMSNDLFFQPVATTKNDLALLCFSDE